MDHKLLVNKNETTIVCKTSNALFGRTNSDINNQKSLTLFSWVEAKTKAVHKNLLFIVIIDWLLLNSSNFNNWFDKIEILVRDLTCVKCVAKVC